MRDSDSLKKTTINRKSVAAIIDKVIAPAQQKRLAKLLKETKFVVQIDESTDISFDQCMCIVVRYFDKERGQIYDSLWDVVEILKGDEHVTANAQTIYNSIITSFEKNEIPLSNISMFCSDTASVMMGINNSVASKLKQKFPNIKIVKCNCHIEHLCAQNAMKMLPCYDFTSTLYNYMSNSSKKMHNYKVLQEKLKLPPLILLKPCLTRWLTYYESVLRLLRR